MRITSFFRPKRNREDNKDNNLHPPNKKGRLIMRRRKTGKTAQAKDGIGILQWNARGLSESKATEISLQAEESEADIICISELHHRRRIPGFQHRLVSERGPNQAGIFWREGVNTERIHDAEIHKHEDHGILTQANLGTTATLSSCTYTSHQVPILIKEQTTGRTSKPFST